MSLRLALVTILTLSVCLADVESQMRACYFGPPKLVRGQHWLQTALREVTQRCRGQESCEKGYPLGMEDGRIPDERITASSVDHQHWRREPFKARLNTQAAPAAWCAGEGDTSLWIQVDFITEVYITGLVTQGRADLSQWVARYIVVVSVDGRHWSHLADGDGGSKQFTGNVDRDSHVTVTLPLALRARFLRIWPTACHGWCSMRFEVIGCYIREQKYC